MTSITFDTLHFVDTLRAAGMPEEQAKAMSTAQKDLLTEVMGTILAGKDELSGVRTGMQHMENQLDRRLDGMDRRMDALEAKLDRLDVRFTSEFALVKWMLGILLGGVVALVLKSFFPALG